MAQPSFASYPSDQARFSQQLKEKDLEIQRLQESVKKAKAGEEKALTASKALERRVRELETENRKLASKPAK